MMIMQINKGTFIFKLALSIYLVTMMLDASMFGYMELFSKVLKGMRYFSYLLLVWKVIEDNRYLPKQLINYGICVFITLIIYQISRDKTIIFLMLFLIAASNVFFREILKISLWTNGLCLAIVIFCYKVGLIPDRYEPNSRKRHALGFNFTTTGSNYWLYFVLLYICYRKRKITWMECILLEAITCYFFAMTDTKNAFAITTLVIIFAYLLKIWKEYYGRYLFGFFIKNITCIGTILFIVLMFLFDKIDFVSKTIDEILSNRLTLSCAAVEDYGVHLFGQSIEWVGGTNIFDTEWRVYNYVDSSYMQILFSYGIIVLMILLIGYHFLGREIVMAKDWYFGLVIVLGAIHSTFDPQFLWMQYNIFILALGYLLLPDRIERRKYLFGSQE